MHPHTQGSNTLYAVLWCVIFLISSHMYYIIMLKLQNRAAVLKKKQNSHSHFQMSQFMNIQNCEAQRP